MVLVMLFLSPIQQNQNTAENSDDWTQTVKNVLSDPPTEHLRECDVEVPLCRLSNAGTNMNVWI